MMTSLWICFIVSLDVVMVASWCHNVDIITLIRLITSLDD